MGENAQASERPGYRDVTGPDGVRVEMTVRGLGKVDFGPGGLASGDPAGAVAGAVLYLLVAVGVFVAFLVRTGRGRRRYGITVTVHTPRPHRFARGFDTLDELRDYQAWLVEEIRERGTAAVPRRDDSAGREKA
ncbi:hypothetical protein [Kitasatospora cheerisanensis]|nr:hypothetical protein [Kitasatospora cheerisanensis]